MTNASLPSSHLILDQESESPPRWSICPSHGEPMTHRRLWLSCDVLICPQCDAYVRARRAWLDELPIVDASTLTPDEAMAALVVLFSDPRV